MSSPLLICAVFFAFLTYASTAISSNLKEDIKQNPNNDEHIDENEANVDTSWANLHIYELAPHENDTDTSNDYDTSHDNDTDTHNDTDSSMPAFECRLYVTLLDLPAWDRTTSTLAYTTKGAQLRFVNSTFSGHIISGTYIISPQNRAMDVNTVSPNILLVTEGAGSVERFDATPMHTVSVYTLGRMQIPQVNYNGIFITGYTDVNENVDEFLPNSGSDTSQIIRVRNTAPQVYLRSEPQNVGFKQLDSIRFTDQNGDDKRYAIFINTNPLSTLFVELGTANLFTLPEGGDPVTAAAAVHLTQTYLDSKFYIAAIGWSDAHNGYYIYRTETPGSTPLDFTAVQLVYAEIETPSHIPNLIYSPPNTNIIYGCKGNVFFRIDKAYTTLVPKALDVEFEFPANTQCRKIISFKHCPEQIYVLLNYMGDGREESVSSVVYSNDFGRSFDNFEPQNGELAHVDIAGVEVNVEP